MHVEQQAIRRLNWATYMVDNDGKNRYPRDDIWLTDGYGDYVRHYLRSMAAQPELAPDDQNHLLRTLLGNSIDLLWQEQDYLHKIRCPLRGAFEVGSMAARAYSGRRNEVELRY